MNPEHLPVVLLGLLIGPLLTGAILGRALHRYAPQAGILASVGGGLIWWKVIHLAAPHLISVHEVFWITPLMVWAAWLFSTSEPAGLRKRALATVLFAGVTEASTLAIGWRPLDNPWGPSLSAGPQGWPFQCHAEVIARHPAEDWRLRPSPWVFHFGDSMTEGPGARETTFVGLLDDSDPARNHLKLALAGTGPECALHLFRQLPDPAAVFLHIFPPNDAYDTTLRYPACHEQTLLDFSHPVLQSRCPDGPRDLPWYRRLAWDPAPFFHRWLSIRSAFFHGLDRYVWNMLPVHLGGLHGAPPTDEAYVIAERIIAQFVVETRTRGVPLYATLMPWSGVRPPNPGWRSPLSADTEAWRDILTRHDVPFLDLTEALRDVTDPPVPGVYVSDDPPDPHFGPLGFHYIREAMAPWVFQRLDHEATAAPHP